MNQDKSKQLQICIILFNCKEDVETYEEIYQKELKAINFNKIIENHFKKYIQKNGRHLSIIAPDYKIYCGTEDRLTVGKEIDIYGESGLHEFISLAKVNNWKIFDKSSNKFIDLNSPMKYRKLSKEKIKYLISFYLELLPLSERENLKYPYLNDDERKREEERLAKLIIESYEDKVFWNNCPKCNKVARTPKAKQCRFCNYDWH